MRTPVVCMVWDKRRKEKTRFSCQEHHFREYILFLIPGDGGGGDDAPCALRKISPALPLPPSTPVRMQERLLFLFYLSHFFDLGVDTSSGVFQRTSCLFLMSTHGTFKFTSRIFDASSYLPLKQEKKDAINSDRIEWWRIFPFRWRTIRVYLYVIVLFTLQIFFSAASASAVMWQTKKNHHCSHDLLRSLIFWSLLDHGFCFSIWSWLGITPNQELCSFPAPV